MVRTDKDNTTEPLIDPPGFAASLASFLIEGSAVVVVLIAASICGIYVADHVLAKSQCTVEKGAAQ
jgi:hypothetical protein